MSELRTAIAKDAKDYRSNEKRYRSRWSWDDVRYGTHCVDCYPGNCSYRVFVKDGRVLREEPTAHHGTVEDGVPDFNPMGCNKGACWSQQLYDGDRITHPMKRVGERGEGRWERITWDEATTILADAMLDAIAEQGPEAIVHEGTPEIATVVPTYRFFNTIGGRLLDLHASFNDFSIGLHETFGKFNPVSSADDWFHSDLILIWHMNPAFTRIPLYHFMLEARYKGAEVASISPDLNASHMHSDYHVPMTPGNDVPFALAMVQVIFEEGLADYDFIRTQTDLPLLVRTDTRRYLRQTDVEGGPNGTNGANSTNGVREDQLYYWDPDAGLVKADRANILQTSRMAALEGTFSVELRDGTTVEVEPVMAVLRRKLDAEYTPEQGQKITSVHPDLVRTLARKVATGRTNIMLGWNSCKYYHGDLIERSMCLLLAVTGNWGKKGTGLRSWTAGMFDGQGLATAKSLPGVEGTEQILGRRDFMIAALRQQDPTMTDELAVREMNHMLSRMGRGPESGGASSSATMSPLLFWWYWQAGFDKRWNKKGWGDDSLPRTFDEYFNEALEQGWWEGVDHPRPDKPPRVLIECGGNMLRRTRGGATVLLDTLWPKLSLIVSIDFRMSLTAQHADLILPAAQHYEKVGFHIPTPHVMNFTFSDRCAEPAGEAKAEWDMFGLILERFAERADERGVTKYTNCRGEIFEPRTAWDDYTLKGYLADEEQLADEIIRDCVYAETLPEGTSLATMREHGQVRFVGWGMMPFALAQASPFPKDETHVPFRNHLEAGEPYPTYCRRAQFYIDHPWWLEAGEELPIYKPNPKAGGDYPLEMTSGHNRWSIHAMNQANPVILQTHRGEPAIEVNTDDAIARGVADDDLICVFNDITSFTGRAKVAPGVRPGQIISYNGWDGHQYKDWRGANEIEAGMVKWIGMAGGYGHINYVESEWQPVPTDRAVRCDFRAVD